MHGVISLKERNSRKHIPTKISSTNGRRLCTESQLLNLYRQISRWRPFSRVHCIVRYSCHSKGTESYFEKIPPSAYKAFHVYAAA